MLRLRSSKSFFVVLLCRTTVPCSWLFLEPLRRPHLTTVSGASFFLLSRSL
ncbi:hypothetical protein Hanom_Chr14g01289831 [Helianthus anomalus]